MRSRMKTELVVDALTMAIKSRQPQPGLIHHSLKNELIYHERFLTRDEAKRSIFGYIEVF